MIQESSVNEPNKGDSISLKEVFLKFGSAFTYLKSKWHVLILISILGAVSGIIYAFTHKNTYTATCTFVLEDAKSTGASQYAGLAALAGISLGSSGGGIFEGDNILELYKSRTMIEKALLSEGDFDGKKQLLIDRFLEKNSGENNKTKQLNFIGKAEDFSRAQDSVITTLAQVFNSGKILKVIRPNTKLNIISVTVETNDELFSKIFNETLVQNVNDFYVQTKTKKLNENVNILQHQVDSVKQTLNKFIGAVAVSNDAAPNANPLMSALRVGAQKKQVDVQASSAVYSEMIKNLELAKVSLRQETPLIQIVDKPVLPLPVNHQGKIKTALIGAILSTVIAALFLLLRKTIKKILK